MDKTVEQLFAEFLGKLMSPTGLGAFAPLLAQMLQSLPGMHGSDLLWQVIPFSQTGNMGTYLQMQRAVSNGVISSAFGSLNDSAKQKWMTDFARTLTSRGAFDNLTDDQRMGMTYEQYIQHKAMGMASNPFWGMAYKWADPDGSLAFTKGLEGAYNNMVRRSPFGVLGSRDTFGAASEVITRLFQAPNGNLSFNSSDYGNFGKGAIAALTNEITRTHDVMRDITDSDDSDQLEAATKNLRDMIQKYAKALAPLKTVFGDDMSKILGTIEQMTGTKASLMSTNQLEHLSDQIIAGTLTGTLDMKQAQATTMYYRSKMAELGMRPTEEVWAGQQAMRANMITNGPAQFGFLSQGYQAKATESQVFNASNSPMADAVAKAYSIWEHDRNAVNRPADFATFQQMLQQRVAANRGNMARAILDMAGASSKFQLEEGLSYGGYRKVKESGEAAAVVENKVTEQKMTQAATRLARDMNLRASLGPRNNNRWARMGNYNMATQILAVEELIAANPELLNLSEEERAKRLNALMSDGGEVRYTVNGQARSMNIKNIFAGDTTAINATMERLKSSDPETVMHLRNRYNREQMLVAQREIKQVQDTVNRFRKGLTGPKELINDFLTTRKGRMDWLTDTLKERGKFFGDLTTKGQQQGFALMQGALLNAADDSKKIEVLEKAAAAGGLTKEQAKELDRLLLFNTEKGRELLSGGATAGHIKPEERKQLLAQDDWKAYKNKVTEGAGTRAQDLLTFYLTDPRANTKAMREERRNLTRFIDKSGKVTSREGLTAAIKRMEVLKDTNADRVEAYLKSTWADEDASGYTGSEQTNAALRNKIMSNGGDISKLNEKEQKAAERLGYGKDANRNMRQARMDRLAAEKATGKNVDDSITKTLIADKTKGNGNLGKLFTAFYEWADKNSEGYTSSAMSKFFESSAYKNNQDLAGIKGLKEQASTIINSVGAKSPSGTTDILGIANGIIMLLREIRDNTDKNKSPDQNTLNAATTPGAPGKLEPGRGGQNSI